LDQTPLSKPDDSVNHTLVEIDDNLSLFGYWRDSPKGVPLTCAKLTRFGTIEAIRQRLLAGAGVGVLPKYLVQKDLDAKRLRIVLPKGVPQHDYFRLVIRADDARRSSFEGLAQSLSEFPLQ